MAEKDLDILLDGKEIEPIGENDFSFRRVPSAKIPYFRGLPSQLTVNPEDKNRIQSWFGDLLGHTEQTVMQSDFDSAMYNAAFKNVSVGYFSKRLDEGNLVLDPNQYGVAFLQLKVPLHLTILNGKHTGTKLQIFFENLYRDISITFPDKVKIQWIGSKPDFPTDGGKTYSISLVWNGTNWIGEMLKGGERKGSGSNKASQRQEMVACLNASIMSLGYCLPAGQSSTGEAPKEYALFSGIADFTDDTLLNIAQCAAHIGNINDVGAKVNDVAVVEDHIEEVARLSANIGNLVTVNNSIENVNAVADNISQILTANQNKAVFEQMIEKIPLAEEVNSKYTSLTETATELEGKHKTISESISSLETKIQELEAKLKELTPASTESQESGSTEQTETTSTDTPAGE